MKPKNAETAMIINTVMFCLRGIVYTFEVYSRCGLRDYFSVDSIIVDLRCLLVEEILSPPQKSDHVSARNFVQFHYCC